MVWIKKLLAILPFKQCYAYQPRKLIWYQFNLNTKLSPLNSGEISQYKDCDSMPPNSIKDINEEKSSAFTIMYHLHLLICDTWTANVNEWHWLLGLDAVMYGCYILVKKRYPGSIFSSSMNQELSKYLLWGRQCGGVKGIRHNCWHHRACDW